MRFFDVPMPENWPRVVRSAMLHVCSLAQFAISCSRSCCANSTVSRARMAAKLDQARNETALLAEENDLLRARLSRLNPRARPHYSPIERMRILELRAARAWNALQTAQRLLIEPDTVSSWLIRIEDGSGLVLTHEPINKFPAFVRYAVRRLKILCPTMGKKRVAEILAACGLYLAATTAGRFFKAKSPEQPDPIVSAAAADNDTEKKPSRTVIARHPNHVWNIDLSVIPTGKGFWCAWLPNSLNLRYPFCFWLAVILDHFSRMVMGFALFLKEPTAREIKLFLSGTIRRVRKAPRHLISDQGTQFIADEFRKYCKNKKINQRFGAVGKHGSIAVIERFFRSLKDECARRIVIPLNIGEMRTEIYLYAVWYNMHRPHQGLNGLTPHNRYHGKSRAPPLLNLKEQQIELRVSYLGGRKHLPIVELKRVYDPEQRRRTA